jgi:hypothetical protein
VSASSKSNVEHSFSTTRYNFVQDQDDHLNQGCSLLALIELAREKGEKGYELACATFCNAIFVLSQEFPVLGITDNTIDSMFAPPVAHIFQGYDGTLFTAGLTLIWHDGTPVAHDALQILPERERVYRDATLYLCLINFLKRFPRLINFLKNFRAKLLHRLCRPWAACAKRTRCFTK